MIFLQLYDGIGEYGLSIALHNLSDNTSIAAPILVSLDFPERLAKMDVAFPVASLRLPRPGRYELAVLLDGQELAPQIFEAEVEDGDREQHVG